MRQIKVKKILEKHLKIKITKNTNIKLNSLKNYDSLILVQIIMAIENINKKKIPLNKLNKIFKINDLFKLLKKNIFVMLIFLDFTIFLIINLRIKI